jgi:hypothetical protein
MTWLCWCYSRGGRAIRMTVDHKATLPEEMKRITDMGCASLVCPVSKRVNGNLIHIHQPIGLTACLLAIMGGCLIQPRFGH